MAAVRADQTVHITTGAASAQGSATYANGQRLVLIATANAWALTGANPTAAANTGVYLPAGVPVTVYIGGDGHKVAAIQASAAGDVTVAPAVGE
jgi:hypothetical protein